MKQRRRVEEMVTCGTVYCALGVLLVAEFSLVLFRRALAVMQYRKDAAVDLVEGYQKC
jgi:hypothetical protein